MKNKYYAKKCKINGTVFDSQKEYRRYSQLQLLLKAGKICDLRRQVKFILIPAQYETYERYGKRGQRLKDGQRLLEKECSYYADYTYTDSNGKLHVEDAKGYKNGGAYAVFSIKRKLMLYIHKIIVEEV